MAKALVLAVIAFFAGFYVLTFIIGFLLAFTLGILDIKVPAIVGPVLITINLIALAGSGYIAYWVYKRFSVPRL